MPRILVCRHCGHRHPVEAGHVPPICTNRHCKRRALWQVDYGDGAPLIAPDEGHDPMFTREDASFLKAHGIGAE